MTETAEIPVLLSSKTTFPVSSCLANTLMAHVTMLHRWGSHNIRSFSWIWSWRILIPCCASKTNTKHVCFSPDCVENKAEGRAAWSIYFMSKYSVAETSCLVSSAVCFGYCKTWLYIPYKKASLKGGKSDLRRSKLQVRGQIFHVSEEGYEEETLLIPNLLEIIASLYP